MSRRFRPPKLGQTSKSEVDTSIHDTIHSSLKALRRGSKQAGSGVNSMKEDLRILERVFYKSNNSQRPAMAWKKLNHMRRICWRLQESELPGFLDTVRLAFYPVGTTTKQLKTAWTHVPSFSYVEACLKRLLLICSLLTKPGTSFKYLRTLDVISGLNAGLPSGQTDFSTIPGETPDIGEAIQRKLAQETQKPTLPMGDPIRIVLLDDDGEDESTLIQPAEPKPVHPQADDTSMDTDPTIIEVVQKSNVDNKSNKTDTKTKKSKKAKASKSKVKRDEIDDIFGF
ncbi:hypothetical protein FRC05_000371 [Tulasnella sp. 425]|nr:hypothetical protein FRC05_000371 [Tulasnella sp. 425]